MKQFYLYLNNLTLKNKLLLFSLKGTGFIFFSFILYILFVNTDTDILFFSLFSAFHYFNSLTDILCIAVENNSNTNLNSQTNTGSAGSVKFNVENAGDIPPLANSMNTRFNSDYSTTTTPSTAEVTSTTSFIDSASISNLSPKDLNNWSETIINKAIGTFTQILEPVSVSYSNDTLATQIYGISIMLFLLSVVIIILILALILNILMWVYSDKLLNLFTNKYIRWYILYNKKVIGIEIAFLSISILYFMYKLSYGLHFIATHPITFN